MVASKGQSDKASMTPGQLKDIIATMIGAIPDLSFAQAHTIRGKKGGLVAGVKSVFAALNTGAPESSPNRRAATRRAKRRTSTATITIDIPVVHTPTPPYAKCTRETDVEVPIGSLTLGLYDFLQPDEDKVKGDLMVARTKEKHPLILGERHARALLAQAHKIPASWQKYVLVFPGTIWQDPGGGRYVFYLCWNVDCWQLGYRSLDGFWREHGRVVVSRM